MSTKPASPAEGVSHSCYRVYQIDYTDGGLERLAQLSPRS